MRCPTPDRAARWFALAAFLWAVNACGLVRHGASTSRSHFVYVGGSGTDILSFQLDVDSGALAFAARTPGGRQPGYLAWNPSRTLLFATNRNDGPSMVVAFGIDARTKALAKINQALTAPGDSPPFLSVDHSGRWVLVAHARSGHVTVHPIGADGAVGAPVDAYLAGNKAHMAMPAPGGNFVFVPCVDSNYVAVLALDVETGKLSEAHAPQPALVPAAGPRHIAFHPTGKFAYVINETNNSITSYRHDIASGSLADPADLPTVPELPGLASAAAHVLVHPNGRFVYGSNRGHDSIVIFSVNQSTGRLTLVGYETAGGSLKSPRHFAIDPAGRFLLAANEDSDSVVVFRIADDGTLQQAGEPIAALGGPSFVGILPAP